MLLKAIYCVLSPPICNSCRKRHLSPP